MMDINWLSVALHFVAARFRLHARVCVLVFAWLLQAEFGAAGAERGRDVGALMRHAVIEVTVTVHAGIRTVEAAVLERLSEKVLEKVIEEMVEGVKRA